MKSKRIKTKKKFFLGGGYSNGVVYVNWKVCCITINVGILMAKSAKLSIEITIVY